MRVKALIGKPAGKSPLVTSVFVFAEVDLVGPINLARFPNLSGLCPVFSSSETMIKAYCNCSARLEESRQHPETSARILCVMKHAMADDDVKGFPGKRQVEEVGLNKVEVSKT